MTRQDWLLQADIDYSAFARELQRVGVDQLTVSIELPQTAFRDYTRTYLVNRPSHSRTCLMYEIPLGKNSTQVSLHLAYGIRRVDVYRALGIFTCFLLLPMLVTVWMRHGALASAREDAPGAWFGFFRRLNWLVTGAMLLWITSGLGARRILQDWVGNQGLSGWSAAAADVLVTVVPAFAIYLVCIALAYPVYAQLRGGWLSRREFLGQQFMTVGAQAVPLTLALASLEILHQRLELSVALLILTVLVLQVFQILKLRVMKTFPQPLTTGELRDRVFALAGRLGVKVSQVFVVPAGKAQVANAYAAKNRVVMFTDYLLEHLSKREVDGVAAHELAHVRHRHPGKRGLAFYAAVLLPTYFTWLETVATSLVRLGLRFLPDRPAVAKFSMIVWRATSAFEQWSQRDFALIMLGLTGFYFLSRRFENVADATAVRLTGDPEAQITGLLKLNRLNFTPIQWGKALESWLTHPSTVRRAERIAAAGGMAPERLNEIFHQHAAQGNAANAVPAKDRYRVPAVGDPETMRAALHDRMTRKGKMWAQLAVYVFPPAVFSLLIQRLELEGTAAAAAYFAGLATTAALITLAGVWLGQAGRAREKRRLAQRFEREHMPVGHADDVVVGFAPGPFPRLYGPKYHWDSGFLVLAKERLQFVGEQTRFSLLTSEIEGIVVGRGGPSWWKFERVYVRWKSADGTRGGVFNLNPLEPGSMWHTRAQVRALCLRLERWQKQAEPCPDVRPGLAELSNPGVAEVTCVSPRSIAKWSANLRVLLYLLPLAIGVGLLMHAEIWYLCCAVMALRLYQSVPYWRYRDRPPEFPPKASIQSPPQTLGASFSAADAR